MTIGRFSKSSLLVKLLIWMGLLGLFFVIFFILTLALAAKGCNMGSPTVMRIILAYQDIFLFIVPALWATALWSTRPMRWLRVDKRPQGGIAVAAMLLMLIALPGNNLLAWLNQQITLPDGWAVLEQWMQQQEDTAQAVLEKLMGQTSLGAFALNLLLVAVMAAIGEEVCFRGVLQGLMGHTGRAIWLTAIIFSLVHVQFYGFIPRMLMGALFGYMLVWSDNLWIPMLMHCTNNAAVTILYHIAMRRGMDTAQMDTFGTGDTLWVGILSIVIVGVGIYCLRRSLTINSASSRTSSGN